MTEQERAQRRIQLSKAKRKKQLRRHMIFGIVAFAAVVLFIFGVWQYAKSKTKPAAGEANADQVTSKLYIADRPELDVQLLPINKYSRSGKALDEFYKRLIRVIIKFARLVLNTAFDRDRVFVAVVRCVCDLIAGNALYDLAA